MVGGGYVTTWTQDYPAVPGSADAAAQHARTVAGLHMPQHRAAAAALVKAMITVGVAWSSSHATLNLVTIVSGGHVRFELHYADDLDVDDPVPAHELISALANAYGERRGGGGRMLYAELWGAFPPDDAPALMRHSTHTRAGGAS